MAKVISVDNKLVSCYVNHGPLLRRYERKSFDWDVLPGDEFRFVKR